MKIITKIFLLAISLGVSTMLYSQDYMRIVDSMKGAKFLEITEVIENSWEGKFKGKHSGYKHYKRWEEYHSTRLTSDGRLKNNSENRWNAYYARQEKNAQLKSSGIFHGNWASLGAHTSIAPVSGGTGIGRVNCVTIDPDNQDIIYVGTPGGGLWRSTDAGSSWSPLTDGMPRLGISGIAIDPTSPVNNRTIYILTGDGDANDTPSLGVYKSTDNGATWYSTGLGSEISRGYKLLMHPNNPDILFAAGSEGIYKTTNAGLNWEANPIGYFLNDRFVDIEFNTANPSIIYLSTYKGRFYRSTDVGETWSLTGQNDLPAPQDIADRRIAIGVTEDDANYVYLVYGGYSDDRTTLPSGTFNGVFRSTDGGISFTEMSTTPNILGGWTSGNDNRTQSWYDLAIAVSPTNKDEVHVGGINCWKSSDGGITWTNTSDWLNNGGPDHYTHADIHALDYYNNILYCASDGGIYISFNDADTWSDISSGLEITQFYRIGTTSNTHGEIVGGAQDNGLNKLENENMLHWWGGDGMESIIDPVNSNLVYGSTQYGTLMKDDDITSFGIDNITPPGKSGTGAWTTPFVMDPNDNNTLYAAYKEVMKSTDGGDTWVAISGSLEPSNYVAIFMAIAPSNSNCIYVSKLGSLHKTANGGSTWEDITNGLPSTHYPSFAINNTNENEVWLCSGTNVFKTIDGGINWTNISYNLPSTTVNTVVHQKGSNNRVYVGTDIGVYYLDDNSTEWTSFDEGLVKVEIRELEINYANNKLRAGTYGRGVWESDLLIDCPEDLVLNETHYGTEVFQATRITSTSTVAANADIEYIASERIVLKSGFKALQSSNFNAKLGSLACGPDAAGLKNSYVKPLTGTYGGPMPGIIENKGETIDESVSSSIDNFSFYPNPASSNITLSFTVDSEQPVNIIIMDMLGSVKDMVVSNEFLSKGEYEITHNLENLDRGAYIINYTNGTQSSTKQIIITK